MSRLEWYKTDVQSSRQRRQIMIDSQTIRDLPELAQPESHRFTTQGRAPSGIAIYSRNDRYIVHVSLDAVQRSHWR